MMTFVRLGKVKEENERLKDQISQLRQESITEIKELKLENARLRA